MEPKTEPAPSHEPGCPVCGRAHAAGAACVPAAGPEGAATLALGAASLAPSPAAPEPADPLVGSTVGSFQVVRLLGRGGMGSVYLAEHPAIGSRVAVKFLHESMASDADLVNRFYGEARAVNLIGHDNIVAIYDLSFLPPSRYYIVMEYLDGETLAQLVRRGPLAPRAAAGILLQLCDALHCAHSRGVVHRDLKPANVFLLKRRGNPHFVKLVDFGIAKLRSGPGRTAAGALLGTPLYMAPEQCDDRPVDARTDVYALGAMAYELVTGKPPFRRQSAAQLLLAQLNEPPAPPRRHDPSLSPALEAAILKALAKRPEDRFPSMAAFGEALAAAVDVRPKPAPPAADPTPPPRIPLAVEVRWPGQIAARRLAATDVSRAGMYVEAHADPPPLLVRVRVRIPRPEPQRALELDAEVVRQVSAADAAAWGMASGFALQWVDLSPEQRAGLAAIAGASPRTSGARAPPGEVEDRAAAALVDGLRARVGGSHYEFLEVAADADFAAVRSRVEELRRSLEGLRGRALSPERAGRVAALLDRVEAAAAVLCVPAERLGYDARRGNHLGVGRCLGAGLPGHLVEARRRAFFAERPGSEERAQRHLVRAKVARAMGNGAVALAEYQAALADDPLNLSLQEAYLALKRELEGARAGR